MACLREGFACTIKAIPKRSAAVGSSHAMNSTIRADRFCCEWRKLLPCADRLAKLIGGQDAPGVSLSFRFIQGRQKLRALVGAHRIEANLRSIKRDSKASRSSAGRLAIAVSISATVLRPRLDHFRPMPCEKL
jgi:hypothetical protein